MADDFISNLQSLTSNLEEIVFTRFATVIKKNDDHTVDCREDSGTVHKNIKHSNLFNFQVGDTVILGFVDNDLYEPVIVGTRDVDLGVPTTEEIDELITDLNTLTTDMTNLKNSLIRFNGELISFSADNHNLAENLSKLKENLKFVLDDVKILDAGLGEFYDVLESFGIDIDEFVETLMGLNIDLNILQGYLSDFSGTLEQFDTKLRNELDEETYNKLNEDMVKLIWSISQVRGRTTTVEGQARHLADEIGDDTGYDPSTTQPSNLKQWIKWIKWKVGDSNSGMIKDIEALEALIGDDTPGAETGIFADLVTANNHITTINSYIYGNGDAQHPASGSILYQINTLVNTDIPKILTDIYGKPDGTSSDYTANSLYGKLVYMENQLWGNGSSGSPSSDSILGRLGAISNNAGTGRLDLLDKQGGTLDNLDSRIKSITNTSGTGSLDVLESTVGDNNSGLVKKANDLDTAIGSNTSGSESGLYLLIKNATDSITNITTNIIGSNTQGHESGIYLLIKNATDSIATINTKIGSNISGSESGLYLALKNATDSISDIATKVGSNVSGSETGIYLLIANLTSRLDGADAIIGTDTPSTGADTIWGRIHAYLTRLDNISNTSGTGALDTLENAVGTVDVAMDGDLANQGLYSRNALSSLLNVFFTNCTVVWVFCEISDFETSSEAKQRYLDEVNAMSNSGLVQSYPYYTCWKNNLTATLTKVTGSGNNDYEIPFSALPSPVVGLCYSFYNKTVISNNGAYPMNEPYDIVYEYKTNKFYVKNNGTWVETNDINDFFEYIALYSVIDSKFAKDTDLTTKADVVHYHNNWQEYDLNSTVFSLYYNPAIRLCELRMTYQISGSASGTGEHTVSTPNIPSDYRPSANVIGTLNRGGGSIRVDSNGNIYWITAVTQSVGTYLYGSVMWHY